MPELPRQSTNVDKALPGNKSGKSLSDDFTMARNRFIRALVILVLAVVYTISPIDLIPEALVGPLGLADDLVVILIGFLYAWYSYSKMKKQRALITR